MSKFSVPWSMYGIAEVEADDATQAAARVDHELRIWQGLGTSIEDLDVDGVTIGHRDIEAII